MDAGESETMLAYSLFVSHNVLPSDFARMSPAEKTILKHFLLKESKDTQKEREKLRRRR